MSEQAAAGIFNDRLLREALASGVILGADPARLQPASLDLTLGSRAWRIRASFLPGDTTRVQDRLDDTLIMHEIDLGGGAVLEKDCVYLVELRERLALPEDVSGHANPKSSTGRIDVFVRLVTDYSAAFERVRAGYHGPLYAEISPRTFSIKVRSGSALNQLRLHRGREVLEDAALSALHDGQALASSTARIEGGLTLTAQIAGRAEEVIGWRARRHAGLIDVDQPGGLDPVGYWEPVRPGPEQRIILDPGEFYILASKEWLRIPDTLAAEMVAIDPLLGEFRAHYAGFFDPGFGCGETGTGNGSRAVLEVRGHEAPFILEDGQPVARLVYEALAEVPETLYGSGLSSNYQGQGLKLSKHFRS